MTLSEYQNDCIANYKKSIGYPEDYSFIRDKEIKTLVPIETALNGVFIIGAYPSAIFETVNGISYTPVNNNASPFSLDNKSGIELNDILAKIDVKRKDCWITDLIKVFLFKKGHVNRYLQLGDTKIKANREQGFYNFGLKSVKWLEMELEIAQPYVIIALGAEVTEILLQQKKINTHKLLDGTARPVKIGCNIYPCIFLPHPGCLIRKGWWYEQFETRISINAKNEISKLKQPPSRK